MARGRRRSGFGGNAAIIAAVGVVAALLIGGGIAALVHFNRQPAAAVATAAPAAAQPQAPGQAVDSRALDVLERTDLTAEQRRAYALQAIDDLTAMEGDPRKPASVPGVRDEDLMATPDEVIQRLFDRTLEAAHASPEPRYLFGLARAAYTKGDDQSALPLFSEAARRGSAAAYGFVGIMVEDAALGDRYLHHAVANGFAPAQQWLVPDQVMPQAPQLADVAPAAEEAGLIDRLISAMGLGQPAAPAPEPFNIARFKHRKMMQALYDGDLVYLNQNMYASSLYVSSINDTILQSAQIIAMQSGDFTINEIIKPGLSQAVMNRYARSPEGQGQGVNFAIEGLGNVIGKWAMAAQNFNDGRGIGASLADIAEAEQTGPASVRLETGRVPQGQFMAEANGDGNVVVKLYVHNRPAFERIYASMQRFAEN